jgi:hypothetical protein
MGNSKGKKESLAINENKLNQSLLAKRGLILFVVVFFSFKEMTS